MKLRESENLWVLGLFLAVTGVLAALILAVASEWTAEPIAKARARREKQAAEAMNLPAFDNEPFSRECRVTGRHGTPVSFYAALAGKKPAGYLAKAEICSGYGGPLSVMASFSPQGEILAVQVLAHRETPGLGAEVCLRKHQRTIFNFWKPVPAGLPPNAVLDQFHGRRARAGAEWKITKDGGDVEFRTGATVTCRAVTSLVSEIAAAFAENRARITETLHRGVGK